MSVALPAADRPENAMSEKPGMHVGGESDGRVVCAGQQRGQVG
jgi:hypothetical protein